MTERDWYDYSADVLIYIVGRPYQAEETITGVVLASSERGAVMKVEDKIKAKYSNASGPNQRAAISKITVRRL